MQPAADLWCGGEEMTTALAADLLPRGRRLWNVYGPTEATIWASAQLVTSPGDITLGTALPGSGMRLSPEGEILLYGAGLASGYLDRPGLTAERFRPTATGLCYHTGDRGQLRPDGRIEFLGRDDDQVKLRGHRIELGEIERTLEAHESVSEAVVVVSAPDDPARTHLTAFVVVRHPEPTVRDLRRWLADRLPASMRPARIEMAAALPPDQRGQDRPQGPAVTLAVLVAERGSLTPVEIVTAAEDTLPVLFVLDRGAGDRLRLVAEALAPTVYADFADAESCADAVAKAGATAVTTFTDRLCPLVAEIRGHGPWPHKEEQRRRLVAAGVSKVRSTPLDHPEQARALLA